MLACLTSTMSRSDTAHFISSYAIGMTFRTGNLRGWTFLPSVKKYYMKGSQSLAWNDSDAFCRGLDAGYSHLIVIDSLAKQQAINSMDRKFSSILELRCGISAPLPEEG